MSRNGQVSVMGLMRECRIGRHYSLSLARLRSTHHLLVVGDRGTSHDNYNKLDNNSLGCVKHYPKQPLPCAEITAWFAIIPFALVQGLACLASPHNLQGRLCGVVWGNKVGQQAETVFHSVCPCDQLQGHQGSFSFLDSHGPSSWGFRVAFVCLSSYLP